MSWRTRTLLETPSNDSVNGMNWPNGTFLAWEQATATANSETLVAFQTSLNSNLADDIGVFGVDPNGDEAWAIINHNSDFAVVPEPSTIVLAAFGLLGGLWTLRRKKNLAVAWIKTTRGLAHFSARGSRNRNRRLMPKNVPDP